MTRLSYLMTPAIAALLAISTAGLAADDGQAPGSKAGTRAVTSCGRLSKTEVARSGVSQSTTSATFVDVVGSTVNFSIGGTANTCILVNFSAQAFANDDIPNRILFVQAVRDGAIVSADGSIQFATQPQELSDAHAYNFIFTNVPPGAHSVKMQYRTSTTDGSVAINDFNMMTHHK